MSDGRSGGGLSDEHYEDPDLVERDDAVIGKAFRWSALFVAAIAAVGGLVYFTLQRPEEAAPEVQLEAAAPEVAPEDIDPPVLPFTDVTSEAGIDFVHHNGATGEKLLPETMGAGAAFLDFDADGDQDLLLVDGAPWPGADPVEPMPTPKLYANDGSGRFTDVTAEAGLSGISIYGMGVAAGDIDGDGWVDLYLTAVGENVLLRNREGVFEDISKEAGVAGEPDAWSSGAAFIDHDADGDLDLLVGNYVVWSPEIDYQIDYRLTGVGRAYGQPQNYQGTYMVLYRNDGGQFTDVSESAGVRIDNPATGAPTAKTLGLAPIDVDQDGYMDVFVANDTVPNFFLHNRGDGTFEEIGKRSGMAYDREGNATGAMGTDAAYLADDDTLTFLVGNFANEMTSVYVSQGDPTIYADEAIGLGIGAPSRLALTFGLFAFDADLDGRLDLLQVNGHLEEEIATVDPSQSYAQAPQLFWNAGWQARTPLIEVPGASIGDLSERIVGRGAAYADIDADGDLDVVLTQAGGPARLLRNDQTHGNHWLRLVLEGSAPNTGGIGATVSVHVGDTVQRRQVMPTRSYLSQVELPLTFGLGAAEAADLVSVRWPDGRTQSIEGVSADQVMTIRQAEAENGPSQ